MAGHAGTVSGVMTGTRGSLDPNQLTAGRPTGRSMLWIAILGAIALGVSSYLLWGSLEGEHLPGCGPESGCDTVLSSRWSSFLGLPVSLPAIVTYLTLLGSLLVLHRSRSTRSHAAVFPLVAALGAVVLGAAIWFIALQFWVIHAICPFCMVAHTCGLVLGILVLRLSWRRPRSALAVTIGGAAVLVMVAGQLFVQPATYEVTGLGTGGVQLAVPGSEPSPNPIPDAQAHAVAGATGTNSPTSATPHRLLQLHGGLFTLDLRTLPVIGSLDASNVVLHFFDYSCDHCRDLHPYLTRAHHVLGDRLAIVQMPIPLEPDCNPIMKRPNPKHLHACAYARLGLAVWRADPAQLEGFEDWIFSSPRPPEPAVVQAEAERRVGTEALASALKDPWIEDYLALSIRIYHTNYLRFGKSQLPLMMVGTNLVSGTVRSTNDLFRLLGVTP